MPYDTYLHGMQYIDKYSIFVLSFATIQSHITQKVFPQYSFIFGYTAKKLRLRKVFCARLTKERCCAFQRYKLLLLDVAGRDQMHSPVFGSTNELHPDSNFPTPTSRKRIGSSVSSQLIKESVKSNRNSWLREQIGLNLKCEDFLVDTGRETH